MPVAGLHGIKEKSPVSGTFEKTLQVTTLFQYLGTGVHENCHTIAAQCLTILEADFCIYLSPDPSSEPAMSGRSLPPNALGQLRCFSDKAGASSPKPLLWQGADLPPDLADSLDVETLAGLRVPVGPGPAGILWAGFDSPKALSPDERRALGIMADALGFVEKLRKADQMRRMGTMARQVAHDLNNILSGLVSYPELILMQLDQESALRDPIAFMHDSGLQAADLVKDFLILARPGENRYLMTISPAGAVDAFFNSQAYAALAAEFPGVRFTCQADPHLPDILATEETIPKLLQVLLGHAARNLAGQGRVSAVLKQKTQPPAQPGSMPVMGVCLMVTDSGTAIRPQDLSHLFDPFYTKKIMGRNDSGLGLAVVHKLLQDLGGEIRISSSPSQGNLSEVFLPPAGP